MMETFPKTTVDVFALVLESGGKYDNLGRLLTALLVLWVSVTMEINLNCNLALADAGIMMCDHITAVSVKRFGNFDTLKFCLTELSWHLAETRWKNHFGRSFSICRVLPQWLTRVTVEEPLPLKLHQLWKLNPNQTFKIIVLALLIQESCGEKLKGAFTPSSCWHEKAEMVEADALKLETGEAPEVMETKAQLESELKKHIETVQDIKPRGMEMDSEDDTKKTILLMP
ncbi:hypothetical protein F2Q70_00019491 [Brassica cretica]|uniref:Uncharacterized protein n=1 Tax=Brassica cretica TaxID=69181 RepID=A0A8S9GSD6_BRACR|nr:hypothetical protein F2Q70_00019491 [Brassica cretica]KAF3611276.1 hypothetical protein DY000_02044528 [Brassica cretica]